MDKKFRRVFLIVLDSFGVGEAPDAAEYGDAGSNTLRSVSESPFFRADNLAKLGLFRIEGARALRRLRAAAGKEPGQGYDDGALGTGGAGFRNSLSHLSARISGRGHRGI